MSDELLEKTETEILKARVNYARALDLLWRPGHEFLANAYVRPTEPNGFEYQTAADGQSGSIEPNWQKAEGVGKTIGDGSITWTASIATGNGSDSISSVNVAVDSTDVVLGPATIEGTEIVFTVSGGLRGQQYMISVEATTAIGEVLEKKIPVYILSD
jgi:hypothetical protein